MRWVQPWLGWELVESGISWLSGANWNMAMWTGETEARWQQLTEEVMTGMKEWRLAHPRATFKEIEAALDERLAKVRARMLQDVALASAAADIKGAEAGE